MHSRDYRSNVLECDLVADSVAVWRTNQGKEFSSLSQQTQRCIPAMALLVQSCRKRPCGDVIAWVTLFFCVRTVSVPDAVLSRCRRVEPAMKSIRASPFVQAQAIIAFPAAFQMVTQMLERAAHVLACLSNLQANAPKAVQNAAAAGMQVAMSGSARRKKRKFNEEKRFLFIYVCLLSERGS